MKLAIDKRKPRPFIFTDKAGETYLNATKLVKNHETYNHYTN